MMSDNDGADAGELPEWDKLIDDVNVRIKILQACWNATATDAPELHQTIVRDVYMPALRLLADFCAVIEIEEDPIP